MASFSVIYVSTAIVLYSFGIGDASLVYANILNLTLRIVYCAHFTSAFFTKCDAREVLRWSNILPRWPVLLVAVGSILALRVSEQALGALSVIEKGGLRALVEAPVVLHIGLGGSLALICLGTWWLTTGRHLTVRSLKTE